MKNLLNIIISFLLLLICGYAQAQPNTPNNTGLPSGGGSGRISYPYNYNQSPNVAPNSHTYVKEYYPRVASTSFSSLISAAKTLSNTTFLDGWGRPLMTINQNGTTQDVVGLYDYRSSDTSIKYLPFAMLTNYNGFINDVFSKQKAYYASNYAAEADNGYSASTFASVSGVPTVSTFAPGRALVGDEKGTVTTTEFNLTNEVLKVTCSGNTVCKNGYYSPNQLMVSISTGQHSQVTYNYTDKDGKLICSVNDDLATYYVYDDLGRLICIVPPKASEQLISNTCVSNVDDLCFRYLYDKYGNVINKFTPGKSDTEVVIFNKYQQAVMFRTPGLRDSSRYRFAIYDKLGRTVMTGIYQGTENIAYWRGVADGSTSPVTHYVSSVAVPDTSTLEYWILNCFSGSKYPSSLYGCTIYSYNYYDDYAKAPATVPSFATTFSSFYTTGPTDETPTPYYQVKGKLVAQQVRILDNGLRNNFTNTPWITSYYFYDEKGRMIQKHTKNPWDKKDTITMQYNFLNQPVRKIESYHVWTGANKPNTKIITWYQYELRTERLNYVQQKIDTFGWEPILRYNFNDLGQVSKQQLCDIEQQFLTYNLRGQLNGINKIYLRGASFPDNMSYASELNYETGFSTKRYDTRLSGYKWKTPSSTVRAYGYVYDSKGRLTNATYRDSSSVGVAAPTWNNTNRDYSVSALTYDANGNIATMTQRGPNTSLAPANIDQLTYTYLNGGNQLLKITDAGVKSNISDFDNGSSGTGNDYAYDHNGNMLSDANKGISIKYNEDDIPVKVLKGSDSIEYVYDGHGVLLQKRILDHGDSSIYRYWGPLVLKNDSLQYLSHGAGRSRWLKDSLFFKQDALVKDHQGNVRTVVTKDMKGGFSLHASFEMAAAHVEDITFANVGTIRDYSPTGTPGDMMSGSLNGTTQQIGTAILIHVMAGDKIGIKSYGYYESTDTSAFNTYATPSTMAGALLTTLTSGTLLAGDGGLVTSDVVTSLLGSTNYAAYDAIKTSVTDRNYPRMYLNMMVFDASMNLISDQCKIEQLRVTDHQWGTMEIPTYTASVGGYILAHVSNESGTSVYVDNTHVQVAKGRLQQEQHYYPHGLVVDDNLATGAFKNRHLFEGNELESNAGMELSDFHFRQYDQQIGRFTSVDPLADVEQEMYSPYHFVYNDPANFADPLGLEGNGWGTEKSGKSNTISGGGSGLSNPNSVANGIKKGVSAAKDFINMVWEFMSTGGKGDFVGADLPELPLMDAGPGVSGASGGRLGGGAPGQGVGSSSNNKKAAGPAPNKDGAAAFGAAMGGGKSPSGHGVAGINRSEIGNSSASDNRIFAGAGGRPSLDDMKKNPPKHPSFKSPKNGDKKVRNPNGKGTGWEDRGGKVWVPTDHDGTHAPHWDVQDPRTGRHNPIYPFVTDPSWVDKIGETVGLSGTALLLYIIISEGTRVIPLRNAIPLP